MSWKFYLSRGSWRKKKESQTAYGVRTYFISTSNFDFVIDVRGVKEIRLMHFKEVCFVYLEEKQWVCTWNLGWFPTKSSIRSYNSIDGCIYFVTVMHFWLHAPQQCPTTGALNWSHIVPQWRSTFGVYLIVPLLPSYLLATQAWCERQSNGSYHGYHLGTALSKKVRVRLKWYTFLTCCLWPTRKRSVTYFWVAPQRLRPTTHKTLLGALRVHFFRSKSKYDICICFYQSEQHLLNIPTLAFTVPTKIINLSRDVVVNEGSNVTLLCQASGKPEPSISWKLISSSGTLFY